MKSIRSKIRLRYRSVAATFAIAFATPLSADVLFLDNFENPDVPSYLQGITPDIWVRATTGFGSGDHGMTDKSGGDFTAPPGNEQAYAFRYTNSGLTTKGNALGPPLIFGGGYEVSFNVVKDNSTGGRGYTASLIAFGTNAPRNDCRSTPSGSTVLASTSGSALADGSITTVTFTFIPNATTHAAEFGKDLGIRLIGSGSSAIIDNVRLRAIPGTSPGLNLVTTSPLDNSSNNLATNPLKAIFNKNIAAGTGNITLRNFTDVIDTVISISDPRIVIAGTCIDIIPGAPLTWGKNYAVLIASNAIVETPGGTPYGGIADDITWNFSTAGGDPLLYSVSQLKSHITGAITLSAAEINTIKLNLDSVAGRFAESSTTITALLDLIATYDTATITGRKGPLWVATGLPKRDAVTNDLHWTIFNVMQNIMDRIYTGPTLAAHEVLLNNFKFGSSANFPGVCAAPAPNTHTATISASYLNSYGPATLADGPGTYARKPTGTYLAPGTIATITVPQALVGTGYKIRVGANSPDFSAKPDIKRLDRVTRVYDINALQTKVANPLGGGIYIEVPFLANAGVVTVDISGAVRSPYFSAKSFHMTSTTEWLTERAHPAPWADFQSDKFIMQVPKSWIFNMTGAQATQLMADWDSAMDAMNDLMGYPHIRGKETMYPQVDLLLKNSVYAPGYPSINTTYSPTGNYGGYANSHLVRGPQFAPDYEFHEQGHAYTFPKFGGESESNVNLHHVAVWNRKFGKTMDEAFRKSRGSGNTYQTLNTTAMAWMCVFNFSPREVPMADGEKAYQLKGHAKFVDIAQMYGWDVLGDFWGSMVDLEETNTAYATDNDAMLLRLCIAVGKDIRPLFHFWGIYPQNPAALSAAIAAANLPADPAIRTRLLYYKTLVPANNAAFRTFALGWWGKQPSINGYWEEREHARQWDTTALYGAGDQQRSEATNPGEIYNENSALDITNRIQELVDLYFPGAITPNTMTFAIVPSAVNATTVGMTATTATAATGPIQYWFENTTNSTNSGWVTSPTWNQTGLTTGLSYSFRVKARDGLGIETLWSLPASATPGNDVTLPSPSPMTFATPPAALGENWITMTATAASDVSGVEYYFDCTTAGGHDSAWQDSPTYTDTGLAFGTAYTYRIQARDKSPAQNPTAFSNPASATTNAPDFTDPTLSSVSPTDGSTDVAVATALTVSFNEEIAIGTGSITLKNLTDTTEALIDINDGDQVTISGNLLTINPTTNFIPGKNFAIQIAPTAIDDLAGNSFAGIIDDSTWNFTTVVIPFVWTQTTGNAQDWVTGTNWLAGTAPSPIAGDTVDFSSANIAANTTLTLSADRSAQLWKFGDATTASHDWTVSAGNKMILAGTTPTINVVNRTATLNNIVAGTAGLTKTGGGTLSLSNTANTYTGGTVINGGNLTIAGNGSLGAAGGAVTFLSSSTFTGPGNLAFNRDIALNSGTNVTWSLNGSTNSGALTGGGTLSCPTGDASGLVSLLSTSNGFTGSIIMGSGIFQSRLTVSSLGDAAGAGQIQLGAISDRGNGTLTWGTGAISALTLNHRKINITSPGGAANLINDNATATNIITVNTDLLSTPAGTKTLALGGTNGGNNLIAGQIVDGGGTVNLTKNGAGKWSVSAANTFTGRTTVNQGTLSTNSIGDVNGGASPLGNPSTAANGLILIGSGNNSGTLLYTGALASTNRTIQLNSSDNTNTGGATIQNNGSGALTFTASPFNNAYTLASAITRTLTLAGSNGGGIQGVIRDNSPTGKVALAKSGGGTWTLSNSNTYTGATTISDGTLLVNSPGSLASGSAVAVNGTSTLGGTGNIGGTVTVAATANLAPGASAGTLAIGGGLNISALANNGAGKLKFELGPIAASDNITVGGMLTIGTAYLGFSDFNFTALPGLQNGTYTLISSATLSGTLAASGLSGAIGSGGTGLLRFTGSTLELVVSGLSITNTYANWIGTYPGAAAMPGFTQDADGDGIKNGMENFFGTNPGTFSAGLVAGTKSGNTFTFTHPQNSTPASDVSAVYRWSKDLATFNAAGATDGAGTTVSFNAVTNLGITTVTATVTGTATAKLFVDVKVTQN